MPKKQLTPRSTRQSTHPGLAIGTFDQLASATMTPASRKRAKQRADALLQRMTLNQLRRDRRRTQAFVAAAMHVDQSEVSRIEKRREVKLSTLRDYVGAMGGYLEVRAVFPEKNVELSFAHD